MKDKYLLHIDFKATDHFRRQTSWVGIICITLAFVFSFVFLGMTFGLHNLSHQAVWVTLIGLLIVIPFIYKDLFDDKQNWYYQASKIVQIEEPVPVQIQYGYTLLLEPRSSDYYETPMNYYCLVLSASGSSDDEPVYEIVHFQKAIHDLVETFPFKDDSVGIQKMRENPVDAKAYLDPSTGDAVMIETEQYRFWVSRMF